MAVRQAAEQGRDHLLDHRHARGTADQHQAVEVTGAQARIAQGLLDRRTNPRQQRRPDLLRTGFIQRPLAADAVTVPAQVLLALAQFALELLDGIGKAGQGLGRKHRGLELPALQAGLQQGGGKVFATEEVVAGRGMHLDQR